MIFFWLIPVLALALLALIWFTRRVATSSSAPTDSDVISTHDALREERNELESRHQKRFGDPG